MVPGRSVRRGGLGSAKHICACWQGVGVALCGEPVVPCVPRVGFQGIGIPGSVAALLLLYDAVSFLRGV